MANTIYDLAKAAGVSIATVSRALNDHYAVSEKTKQRILALAEEMDYRPNARARKGLLPPRRRHVRQQPFGCADDKAFAAHKSGSGEFSAAVKGKTLADLHVGGGD